MKFLSNILIKAGLLVEGTTTLSTIANASTDTDRFIVSDSGVIKYRTGSQLLSDIGAADDSLVVHKAGSETITGIKTFNLGIVLPNYAPINLSNSARIEGYDGKVLFRTVYGAAGYFQDNSLYLAQMDNDASTAGIGVLVKNFGTESKVSYKTAAQMLTFIGAQGSLILTTTGSSGAATLVSNTLNIPNYTLSGLGGVPSSRTLTINGTALDLSADRSWSVGTVTSVGLTVPTGFSVSNSPIISSGNIAIAFAAGYSLPTTASQSNWDTAYNNRITSLTTTGSSGPATLVSNTLNIPQYTLAGLGGVPTTRSLTINGTSYDLSADRSWSVGTVTSVGLTMPAAFTVSNSPITGSGNIAVTGAGLASQYVRGDGTLADFPTGGGGGASVSYYMNGSVNQGTFGGNIYYELNKNPIIGVGTDFTINTSGYIAQFLTDANDPALLNIPGGNWNLELYFSASSGGGTPSFYVELYKYNGTTFTLLASNSGSPEIITGGTSIDAYFTSLAVPTTTLTLTDRLAIRVYVNNAGRTITLHTENSHLCQVITTFTTGLTALNSLTAQVQYLTTGTSGTDFNISSSVATHTFNIPTASATNRGALSTTDWSTFNNKVGGSGVNTQAAFFTGTNTIAGSSVLILDGSNIAIGQAAAAQKLSVNGDVSITTINNATTDTDRFLVSDGGIIKYRTGTQLLSDIGGQGALTLTTTGTSGAATLVGNTLNIPQYQAVLTNPVTGTGTTNYLSKFTGSTTLANSQIFDNGSSVGVGTATPSGSYKLDVNGNINVSNAVNYSQGGTKYGWTYATVAAMAVEGLQGAGISFGTGIGAVATERVAIANNGNVTFSVINNATTDTDRFLVSDSGVLKYRTGSEVLSDIGAAASTSISGTTNYIPKFTSSSAIGNSNASDNGTTFDVAIKGKFTGTSGSDILTLSAPTNGGKLTFAVGSSTTGSLGSALALFGSGVATDLGITAESSSKLIFGSNNQIRMTLDASGNLGLGTSAFPTTSVSHFKVNSNAFLTDNGNTSLAHNAYWNSAWFYNATAAASLYQMDGAIHLWYSKASGTAGTAVGFSERMRLDASGNLGLGVTPSASADPVFQSRYGVFIGNDEINITNNAYFNAGWKYVQTGFFANRYYQNGYNGGHQWLIAPSGTAGTAISFTQAMTLTSGGELLIGSTGIYGGGSNNESELLVVGTPPSNDVDRGLISFMDNRAFNTSGLGAKVMMGGRYNNAGAITFFAGLAGLKENTTDGNYAGALAFYTRPDGAASSERMRLTSGGNLGLGVTPSAWGSSFRALQVGAGASFYGLNDARYSVMGANTFYNGTTDTYIANGVATLYVQGLGQHTWYTAPSGTAGNAISFTQAMTLFSTGNLAVGGTSDNGSRLNVTGAATFAGNATNGTPFLTLNATSANNIFNWVSTAFASNLASGNNLVHFIGQSGSVKNSAYLGFKYAGAGSNDNILTLGLYGVDNILNINGLGNVGIGTTSPSTALNIESAVNANLGNVSITSNNNDASGLSFKVRNSPSDPTNSRSWMIHNNYSAAGTLEFLSSTTATGNPTTPRMTLLGNGNVGIGTTSPAARLDVVGNSPSIYITDNLGALAEHGFQFYAAGSGLRGGLTLDYNNAELKHWAGIATNTYYQTFYTNGSERMRITSGGNVGIGIQTDNPIGNGGTFRNLLVGNGAGYAAFQGVSTATATNSTIVAFSGGTTGASGSKNGGSINLELDGTSTTNATGRWAFYTGNSAGNILERMRITSGGNVNIGGNYTSTAAKLSVANAAVGTAAIFTNTNDADLFINFNTNLTTLMNTAGSAALAFGTANTERMRITSGGEVYIGNNPADQGAYNLQVNGTGVWGAGAYVNGSDSALKENIFDLDGCLDLVKQLKPVTYKYKQSYSRDTSTQTGFIAQDLKELFKDKSYLGGLVKEGGQHLSVAYQNLIPVLAKAIQELEAEIEILKNK